MTVFVSDHFGPRLSRSDHYDVTAQGRNQNPENDPCIAEEIVMNEGDQERRTVSPQGYVLGAGEGEHLIHFRDHGQIVIKADSATGFDNLALGTQQVTVGAGVPIPSRPLAPPLDRRGKLAATVSSMRVKRPLPVAVEPE